MKKGLNVTLMTVAFAMLCMQAMALAPVISDIQSPVIGNEGVTGSNTYLWADAINLDANVSDDATADADILWSYTIIGTPIYRLNNVDPLNLSSDDPKSPSTAKRLDGTTTDPADGDASANTVTFRNIKYTPIGGTAVAPAQANGSLIDEQIVTLFASDSTSYSSKNVYFYTLVGGSDRWGTTPPQTNTSVNIPVNLNIGSTGWTYDSAAAIGSITSSGTSGSSICLEVAAAGDNMAFDGWKSAFGYIPLVDNAVYKLRFRLTTNQSAPVTAPFWDIIINNFDGTNGLNLFGGDYYFLDNEGSANAPTQAGRDFFVWWAPAALTNAAFRNTTTGVYASSVGNNKNARVQFRIMDVAAQGGLTAGNDAGRLCITQVEASRFDFGSMQDLGSVYSNTSLASGNYFAQAFVGSTVAFASGALTLTNVSGSMGAEFIQTYPGDATIDYNTPSSLTDNFPVTWESNTLYMITVELSAPATASETHPYDVLWVGMDAASNEVLSESFVTYKQNFCAMPKTGTPQVYRSFHWSHTVSNSATAQFKRLRPKFNAGNAAGLNDDVSSTGQVVANGTSGATEMNSGGVRIHSMKVNKVSFQ